MVAKHMELIGVSVLVLTATATVALPQNLNPSNPLVLPQTPQNRVSPTLPSGLLGGTTGLNPLTCLPCAGAGSLAVTGVGGLSGLHSTC
jgi:hypothetical protein